MLLVTANDMSHYLLTPAQPSSLLPQAKDTVYFGDSLSNSRSVRYSTHTLGQPDRTRARWRYSKGPGTERDEDMVNR